MLLIAEIGLTIWACIRLGQAKKGWALGLVPIGAAIVGGFIFGAILGALGAAASLVTAIGLIIDFAVIGVLIWMIVVNKPRQTPPPVPPVQ